MFHSSVTLRIFPALLALSLGSCMVGPDFESPRPEMPASWQASKPPASDQDSLVKWWSLFKDPQLDRLIQQGVDNNQDLRTAVLRVLESREAITKANAALLPSLDSSLGTSRGTSNGFGSSPRGNFSGALDASWEIDLFGGNRRNLEATIADMYSTEADAVAIRNSLLAEIAVTYFDWISYTEQISMAQQQLVLQKKSRDIAVTRWQGGLTSKLDADQAEAQVANTEASLPALRTQQNTAKNSLAILLGIFPSSLNLKVPSVAVHSRLPSVPVGLPSDLLRRRPDIIQAEMNLHASTARIGVAVSDLYPKFSLSGGASSSTRDFSNWFQNRSSGWSIGAGVRWPVFDAGVIRANIKIQELATERSYLAYEKSILNAVNEVENSLTTYANSKIQLGYLVKSVEHTENAYELSLKQYAEGETEFINVISAQRSLLSSKESVISTRQRIRQSVAELAKALGGGWSGAR